MNPEYLTVQEAAAILRVHKTALYRKVKRGEYNTVRIGSAIRIPAHEVHAPRIPAPNPYRTTSSNVIPLFSTRER